MLALTGDGGIEHPGNHVDASVLDLSGLGVLLVVDEVLAKGLRHEFFDFIFLFPLAIVHIQDNSIGSYHVRGDETRQATTLAGSSMILRGGHT